MRAGSKSHSTFSRQPWHAPRAQRSFKNGTCGCGEMRTGLSALPSKLQQNCTKNPRPEWRCGCLDQESLLLRACERDGCGGEVAVKSQSSPVWACMAYLCKKYKFSAKLLARKTTTADVTQTLKTSRDWTASKGKTYRRSPKS